MEVEPLSNFWEKILLHLGLAEEEDERGDEPVEDSSNDYREIKSQKGRVLSLHTAKNQRVMILRPDDFGDVKNVADHLKSRRTIVLNLEDAELEDAKRILDFISGTAYALNCNVQKISENIFIFSPDGVDLSVDVKKEMLEKGIAYPEESFK